MTIDCTLDSLKIPALPTYINEFGTKKGSGGLTTAECADDAMLPFRKMRAYTVSESSETTEIQHNAVFIMTEAGISLALHDCSSKFLGCEVRVINTSSGDVTVLGGVSGIDGGISGAVVPPEREARFVFLSDGWHSSYSPFENITEKELADSSVTTEKIADLNVTADKIATGAITADKIAKGAVSLDEIKNQELFDLLYPVGVAYVQYPQMDSPNDLWGELSTWEVVDYSGAFFRAEGGNAAGFIEKTSALSKQAEQISSHSHSISHTHTRGSMNITGKVGSALVNNNDSTGAFWQYTTNVGWYGSSLANTVLFGFDASRSWSGETSEPSNGQSGSAGGNENRPANFTVRIWKRVA